MNHRIPRTKSLSWLLVLGCCLVTGDLHLAPRAAEQGPRIAGSDFVLYPAAGAPITGRLATLKADWSVEIAGPTHSRVQGADLVSLRRPDQPIPGPPTGPQIVFANGDRLPGTPLSLTGDRLRLQTPLAEKGELTIPLDTLAVVYLAEPLAGNGSPAMVKRLLAERRTRDRVLLRNGDDLEGTLIGLDDDDGRSMLRMEVDRRDVAVERNRVAVLALNTELTRRLRPRGPYGRVILTDGTRLGLLSAELKALHLEGRTLFGPTVRIPLDQVVALDIYQGRAVYLSDLKPRRYQFTPFLGETFSHADDASVAGGELRLGGSVYDRGLGMHSQSTLTYDLAGKYRRFQALVGLDDRTGQKGSVRIRVLVDGKPAPIGWEKELTAADGARRLDVDVTGARELTLVVEFGSGGNVQDHVNWAAARLIR